MGEDDVDEFSCLLVDEDETLSSMLRTRWANFSEQTDSLMLLGNGDTWTQDSLFQHVMTKQTNS